MRFGLCCSLADASAALATGFDYVELPASQLLGNEAAYAAVAPEATNLFFPGHIRLVGPDATPTHEYGIAVVSAAARIGIRTMVIGSGGARRCPNGVELEEAEAKFVRVAADISAFAESVGVTIAPESLTRLETNVGNDLPSLAVNLRAAGVGYTADSYHAITEWVLDGHQEPAPLEYWRDQIPFLPSHVHLGGRDRVDPLPGDPDLQGFIKRLYELGYDGRVSLECSRRPGQALSKTLADVRSLFN